MNEPKPPRKRARRGKRFDKASIAQAELRDRVEKQLEQNSAELSRERLEARVQIEKRKIDEELGAAMKELLELMRKRKAADERWRQREQAKERIRDAALAHDADQAARAERALANLAKSTIVAQIKADLSAKSPPVPKSQKS